MLLSGIVGAVLVGIWVDRTKTFKLTTIVLSIANVAMLILVNQSLYWIDYSKTRFIICICFMGFSSIAYIPLTLGFAAELTFPL